MKIVMSAKQLFSSTLLALMFTSCGVWAHENDGPGFDPNVPRKASLLAADQSFKPPEASDVCFVVTEGGDIGKEVWTDGSINITLPINRYFGNKQKLIESKALPKTVKLIMVVWDVDDQSSYTPAEYDAVFINNNAPQNRKALYGVNEGLARDEFLFNIEDINLPERPGETAENKIRIDVATHGGNWVTKINWVALEIPAPPPVILAHGINSTSTTMDQIKRLIAEQTGLPCESVAFHNFGNNHILEFDELSKAITDCKNSNKVDHVTIVAHSMGGLRARGYTENATDVLRVIQIATPNGGSPIADYVIDMKNTVEANFSRMRIENPTAMSTTEYQNLLGEARNAVLVLAHDIANMDLNPWEDPAVECLMTQSMATYNSQNHRLNPKVDYCVVAGNVTQYDTFSKANAVRHAVRNRLGRAILNRIIRSYVEDATNNPTVQRELTTYLENHLEEIGTQVFNNSDLIVPVSSAFQVVPALGEALDGHFNEVWHSGLIRDGAQRVMNRIMSKLTEKKYPNSDGNDKYSGTPKKMCSLRELYKQTDATKGSASGESELSNCIESGILVDAQTSFFEFGVVKGNHIVITIDYLAKSINDAEIYLRSPSGNAYTSSSGGVVIDKKDSSAIIVVANPEPGKWSLGIKPSFDNAGEIGMWMAMMYEYEDGVEFVPSLVSSTASVENGFVATVSPRIGGQLATGNIDVILTSPTGTEEKYFMHDDGVSPDSVAGDGTFSVALPTTMAGSYKMSFRLKATSPVEISRTSNLSGTACNFTSTIGNLFSTFVQDVNDNGLYDSLTVNFTVNTTKAGTYRLAATLSDIEGHEITEGWTSNIVCAIGTHTLPVSFDGYDIFNNGECGGYVVSSARLLEIGDDYEAVVDERVNIFTTSEYNYRQFEHSLVGMTSGSESARDTDDDGCFDILDVAISLYADDLISGDYEWSASLMNAEGNLLGVDSGNVTFLSGTGGSTISLSFEGSGIAATDLDGPFYVKNLILWGNGRNFTISGEYATKPYSIKQWGGTPRHKPRYDFVDKAWSFKEGSTATIRVAGGDAAGACSMQMYLTYNTAAAADLDLANGTVDGVKPKGGLKFPLTLSWAAGETGEKVVEIPIKADAAIEDNEFFTLQLCDPAGMQLGDYRVCTVTIQDGNTKATLADGIGNQSLKPSTSGAGKWYAVESWMADPAEPDRMMFVQSPDLLTGSTSTFSCGSIKGAGSLYFDLKFIGETGNGASYVEVYSGKNKLGTITCSANGEGWNTWHVDTETTGTHNFTLVLTQGADRNSHVRISNVVWRPSDTSSYSEINISTYPDGAGVVSGAGTYANGTKINFNAIPRPGYTFVGWYRTSGALFGSKAKMSVNMTGSADFIAVFSKAPYVRGLADPASAGKVSGSGPCASGKKVTLKATANKGYVLAGWFNERDDRISQTASLVVDNSAKPAKPSATSYVISNVVSDVTYYARFVTVAEDVASISCSVGGLVFPEGDSPTLDASVPCGVRLDWPVLTSGLSQTSAKVAGLPAGLKFNAATGCIEGAPTTPSKTDKTGNVVPSAVKITVTTAGKSSKVFFVNLTVTAMPAAVVGTFNGFVSEYDSDEHIYYRGSSYASFTLTTTAAGKITAKAVSPKGTVSFTANCWDEIVDEGQYAVMLTARTGEMLYLYVDSVPEYWNGVNHSYGYLMGGSYGSEWLYVEAQRSSFLKAGKDYEHPDAVELAKAMQGTYKFDATYTGDGEYTLVRSTAKTATLSVTIKNTGAVTVAGTLPGTSYKVSGAGVLRVYPLEKMADVYVCGASGKIVNIMIELDASIGDDGSVALTGYAFVNLME